MADCDDRDRRRSAHRIPAAGFPREKWLSDFDYNANPHIQPAVIAQLATSAGWARASRTDLCDALRRRCSDADEQEVESAPPVAVRARVPLRARLFDLGITLGGLGVVLAAVARAHREPLPVGASLAVLLGAPLLVAALCSVTLGVKLARFGGGAHVTLDCAVLVLLAETVPPASALLSWLAGVVVSELLPRSRSWDVRAFNIGLSALAGAVLVLALHAYGGADPLRPRALAALGAGTAGHFLVDLVGTAVSVAWVERRRVRDAVADPSAPVAASAVLAVNGIGLAAAVLLHSAAWSVVLLVPALLAPLHAGRTGARANRERARTAALFEAAAGVQQAQRREEVVHIVLEAAQRVTAAPGASLVTQPPPTNHFSAAVPRAASATASSTVAPSTTAPACRDPTTRASAAGASTTCASTTCASTTGGAPTTVTGGPESLWLLMAPRAGKNRFDEADAGALQVLAALTGQALDRIDDLEQMDRAARSDPLTGLANRRELVDALHAAVNTASATGASACAHDSRRADSGTRGTECGPGVVYLDLDGFKTVNDTYGHAVGDELLVGVAQALAATVREQDLVARPGGDEFVALLQDVDQAEAEEAAARLAAAVQDVVARVEHTVPGPVRVSASTGVSVHRPGTSAEALLAQADAQMYAGRRSRQSDGPRRAARPLPVDAR